MRLALISDIHGNLEALSAVLRDIERAGADEIACLGDVVGYGCDPAPCLDLVSRTCRIKLMGNHDAAVLGQTSIDAYTIAARVAAEWTKEVLSDRDLDILRSFTLDHRVADALLVHASPYEPAGWHYILTTAEASVAFGNFSERLCFHGHSHIPGIFTEVPLGLPRHKAAHTFDPHEESRYLVNIGSVGQPRDEDPRACWVRYDTEQRSVEYNRVEYDISQTQAKMTEAHLPQALVNRLAVGR